MSVRALSAQRVAVPASFQVIREVQMLKSLQKYAALSSPKAKVTRSNRVGCARDLAAFSVLNGAGFTMVSPEFCVSRTPTGSRPSFSRRQDPRATESKAHERAT